MPVLSGDQTLVSRVLSAHANLCTSLTIVVRSTFILLNTLYLLLKIAQPVHIKRYKKYQQFVTIISIS